MKRIIGALAATLLLAGMALLAGCGGDSGQASDAQAQASESMQQGGAQNGMQGTAASELDLSEVPIYPGAEESTMAAGGPGGMGGQSMGGGMPPDDSTAPPDGTTQGGTQPSGTPPSGSMPGPMSMVMYTTTDAADTVTAWYREQLSGRDGFAETTGQAGPDGGTRTVFTFETSDGTTMSVSVGAGMQGQGGTVIRIAEGDGQMPSGPPPGQSQSQ